jgi:hypothetical protein
MAGRYNFEIKQGVPFSVTMVWKDSAGTAVNLTGKTARLVAKVRKTDIEGVIDLSQTAGITLGTTNGNVTISLTESQTRALTFKYAAYDLFIGDHHLVSGEITVRKTTIDE